MLTKSNILIAISILCSLLCSFNSFVGFRAIIVICMLLLAFGPNYYKIYPIALFFYSQFGLLFGFSVLRIFSVLLIFNFFIICRKKGKYRIIYEDSILLSVYLIYIFTALAKESLSLALSTLLNVSTIGILAFFYLREKDKLYGFFGVYNIVALASIPAGLIQSNSMVNQQVINGSLIEMSRFMGTFDDPNYMTFFFYIGIISLFTLKLYDMKIRIIVICIFQVCILSTLSITGVICGLIIWLACLLLENKLNLKSVIIVFGAIGLIYGGYSYGLQNPETPILGDLVLRISEKTSFLSTGDIAGATTSRTSFAQSHFDYYANQNVLRMLFGGNLANTKIMRVGNMNYAAHNEYVDILLNIGMVGTIIYFACIVKKIKNILKLRKQNEINLKYCNCIFMTKLVWFLYAMTLTMFLEERFLLFILL